MSLLVVVLSMESYFSSGSVRVISGVPQGNHLAPIIFFLFVNDSYGCISRRRYLAYSEVYLPKYEYLNKYIRFRFSRFLYKYFVQNGKQHKYQEEHLIINSKRNIDVTTIETRLG